jgi:hypothetical protein
MPLGQQGLFFEIVAKQVFIGSEGRSHWLTWTSALLLPSFLFLSMKLHPFLGGASSQSKV